MKLLNLILLLFYLTATESSVYRNIKDTVQSLLGRVREDTDDDYPHGKVRHKEDLKYLRTAQDEEADAENARGKAKVLRKARTDEHRLNHGRDINPFKGAGDPNIGKEYYHMDAVLNQVRRSRGGKSKDSSSSSSSSLEMNDWKDDFNTMWLEKKFEAINGTGIRGDKVNMVAARPWGVPCGDPNQHDMPWGSCMLASECDAEYRIYRGDYFCGRTLYICCALQYTNYDLYQGFDVSFDDSSFSTDSEEKKDRDRGSKENKKRNKRKERRKREKDRKRRKHKIKKQIRKIVHEIRKILNRSYRNSTHHRKKRTKLLKKYIKLLKKQYRKDRKSVRDIHTDDLERIDDALEERLNQIKHMNKNFVNNATFRDIVVNGTINKQGARMLAQAYPELKELLKSRMRRGGGGLVDDEDEGKQPNDYLGYDVEYGALYY